jgi:hypothetical protein
MYDHPPPYSGIFQGQQQTQYKFDEHHRVNQVSSGFVNPNDPSKVYVAAQPPSAPSQPDEAPPSYSESQKKKE